MSVVDDLVSMAKIIGKVMAKGDTRVAGIVELAAQASAVLSNFSAQPGVPDPAVAKLRAQVAALEARVLEHHERVKGRLGL